MFCENFHLLSNTVSALISIFLCLSGIYLTALSGLLNYSSFLLLCVINNSSDEDMCSRVLDLKVSRHSTGTVVCGHHNCI